MQVGQTKLKVEDFAFNVTPNTGSLNALNVLHHKSHNYLMSELAPLITQ